MNVEIDIVSVLYIIGAAQGLFLATALATKDIGSHQANRYLALFLLLFSLSLIDEFFYRTHYFYQFPHLIGIIWPLDFLYGPLFYFYLKTLTVRYTLQINLSNTKHFILFGLGILLAIPSWMLSGGEKISSLYNLVNSPSQLQVTASIADTFASLFALIQMATYLVICIRQLKLHRSLIENNYSAPEKMNLAWLYSLLILLVPLWGLYLLDIFLSEPLGLGDAFGNILHLALVIIFYVMGYRGLKQGQIFQSPQEMDYPVHQHQSKYATSTLTMQESKNLAQKLQRCMIETRPHLNNTLTLAELAEMLNTSRHRLSQVINEQQGKSFLEFINQYRVKEAEKLLQIPSSNVAIIDIAMEAGFNSKSAFYEAFRKYTGKTPSQFRKDAQNSGTSNQ